MAAHCTVCNHQSLSVINAALNAKQSHRRVAASFGLGKDAINRHVMNQHPGVTIEGVEPNPEVTGETPREKLTSLINIMEAQVRSGNARVDTMRELRIAYGELDKLSGGEGPSMVTLREVDGLIDFLKEAFVALEPYPEARMALVPVLEKHSVG
jgi:hypothetical protein